MPTIPASSPRPAMKSWGDFYWIETALAAMAIPVEALRPAFLPSEYDAAAHDDAPAYSLSAEELERMAEELGGAS